MRKLLSVLLTVCILATLLTAMPAMASGGVSIDEIYYKISGAEIDKLEAGTIRPNIVISNNSGQDKEVNVFSALFTSDRRIESIKMASGTVSAGTDEYFGPAIEVASATGKELRTFVWEKDSYAPADNFKTFTDAQAAVIESITLYADDTSCEGIIDDTAKTVTFPITAYKVGDTASSMPDLSDASYNVVGMDMEVVAENDKVYLKSVADNAPTKKYEVKTENWILQKKVDFDNLAIGTATASADGGEGQEGKIEFSNTAESGIFAKPKDNSNDTETDDNAYKFVGANNNTKTWLVSDTSYLTEKVSEIRFKFDMRIDDFGTNGESGFYQYGQLHVSQGLGDRDFPYELSMAFGNATASKVVDTTKIGENQYSFGYSVSRASGGYGKLTNAPVLDMKKWYSFEILFKIDNGTGDYSYEFFVDGTSAGVIKNCFKNGNPSALVSGKGITSYASSEYKNVYNFTAFARKQVGETAYFDNISVEYKRADAIPNVYILGDSLMADYNELTSVRRGWGEFIGDYFDESQVRFQNMAKSGHRASFYINGGNNAASGNKWYGADWYGIESQIKEGDYVIISVGFNDSIRPASECDHAAKLSENLTSLISMAKATGAEVIVASEPPHIGSYTDSNSSKYMQFSEKSCNTTIKAAAEAAGATFLDLSAASDEAFEGYVAKYIAENKEAYMADYSVDEDTATKILDYNARDMIFYGKGQECRGDASSEDWTHYEIVGAELVAGAMAELIKENGGALATYANDYTAVGNDTTVNAATITVGGQTFDGIVNNETKEITFYPQTFRYNNMFETGATVYAMGTDNSFALGYPTNIQTATVVLDTGATVDKNNVEVDLSDGNVVDFTVTAANGDSVTYKVSAVESALSVYSHFNGTLRVNEEHRMNLPNWDNLIKTIDNLQYTYGNTTFRWISDRQHDGITTAQTYHENSTTDKYFKITKSDPAVGRGFYAYLGGNGACEETISKVVTSYDIMIEDLDGGKGFFAGLIGDRQGQDTYTADENVRQALVFTREELSEIDTGIELKYVDNYKNNTLKDIPNAPMLEFNRWYEILTVQEDALNGDVYTTTTDLYLDGEYIGSFSSDYAENLQFGVQTAFGSWCEKDYKTAYSVRIDDLEVVTDLGGLTLHKVKATGSAYVIGDAMTR